MILDAIRFILAKYGPVGRHGDLFCDIFVFFRKRARWETTLLELRVPSEFRHALSKTVKTILTRKVPGICHINILNSERLL